MGLCGIPARGYGAEKSMGQCGVRWGGGVVPGDRFPWGKISLLTLSYQEHQMLRDALLYFISLIWDEKKRLNKGADVVEKRGPYIMSKPPSIQAKLKRQRELAKAALRRQGLLGAPTALKPTPKRSVKFNKGYTALSQTADENLQVTQDLSRQLLQDGYHLDEVPDDEDLDLIPPKPAASSSCPCCFGENLSCVIQ
ncbi:hypothetical protein DV515_00015688 [Chloebia gouldiae]|uniref:Protein FAM219B n=1 Tax=Chloebia gouldiae TaxID=44316 RepID=A0A3L8RVW5_CHLGU|nr:hypothetical protein DV515_00015688 [Chloebia gouldiae]